MPRFPAIRSLFSGLSIRRKLVFGFAVISLIPATILGVYLLASLFAHAETNAERSISDKLRIGTLMWEVRKQSLEDLARTTAADNFVVLNRDLGLEIGRAHV